MDSVIAFKHDTKPIVYMGVLPVHISKLSRFTEKLCMYSRWCDRPPKHIKFNAIPDSGSYKWNSVKWRKPTSGLILKVNRYISGDGRRILVSGKFETLEDKRWFVDEINSYLLRNDLEKVVNGKFRTSIALVDGSCSLFAEYSIL